MNFSRLIRITFILLTAIALTLSPASASEQKSSKSKTEKTTKKSSSATKKSDSGKGKGKSTESKKQTDSKKSADSKKSGSKKEKSSGKASAKQADKPASKTDAKSAKNKRGAAQKEEAAKKSGNRKSDAKKADTKKSDTKKADSKKAGSKKEAVKAEESKTSKKRGSKQTAKETADKNVNTKTTNKKKSNKQASNVDDSKSAKQSKTHQSGSKAKAATNDAKSAKQSKASQAKTESESSARGNSSVKARSRNNQQSTGNESTKTDSKRKNTTASSSANTDSKASESKNSRKSSKSANKSTAESGDSLTQQVNKHVVNNLPKTVKGDGLRVNSVRTDSKRRKVDVELAEGFTNVPVDKDFIKNIEKSVSRALPESMSNYRVNLNVGDRPLSYYIAKVDKLPSTSRVNEPFVVAKEPYCNPSKGMDGDIVAMWHSHGRYYRGGSGWQWQRPFLFETAEDVFTMGYVLPYIVPMLENAGAYVILPRERDPGKNEVIVDNDVNPGGMIFSQPYYKEESGRTKWEEGELEGFIYDLPDFRDTENPFEGGTYRQTETVKSGKLSKAGWYADIPEDGEYAVYVSYKSLPNSTKDAHYTVNYSGGSREFIVNQSMGGGTWIYLGTFPLEAGYSDTEPVVVLSNESKTPGKIVTADAVKIGGGMGNIARSSSRSDVTHDPSTPVKETKKYDSEDDEEGEDEDVDEQLADDAPQSKSYKSGRFSTSGMPRFVEGARYWLHWAGFPESVYSPYHGRDDYKDDYTSRGHWVNYLAGGSRVLPNSKGLKIPVDISMALHSDAGKRNDDSVVGTLGIYYTNGGKKYADGTPRSNSRMLTDLIMRQITGDVRAEHEPNWTRRSMWDKSYLEARVPEVPTTLIELLSHQNFGDMIYGLDPNFRFTVGRAIYKGMARFLAERKGRQLVIQPLPVKDFAIQRVRKGHYKLSWEPTPDPLEPTAMPTKYVIFERTDGNLGFRKIAEVKGTSFELKVTDHEVHSFKIVASNDGGLSFPSEVLALREGTTSAAPMLIVNGFTRIAAPKIYKEGNNAGFKSEEDFGVPYIRDISFSGHQREYRRSSGNSFGISNTNYVTEVVAGNTFDFVSEHGMSIGEAGNGFVSCSAMAVETGKVKLSNYPVVDLILGKQKGTEVGKGHSGVHYRAFPAELQSKLRSYVSDGGNLLVSGAYVASDLYGEYSDEADRRFAQEVLGVSAGDSRAHNGKITSKSGSGQYNYSNTLNDKIYIVERPDELEPERGSQSILQFSDTKKSAAVAGQHGKGKVIVMSVPFETIAGEERRDALMKDFLKYFGK